MQNQPGFMDRLANISVIATALIAVLALIIAVWQIQASAKIEREASARDAFKEYLKIAIDKPELADARLTAIDKNDQSRSSYVWFVTYFLYSAEQIFDSYPDDPHWQAGLAEEICYHQLYLAGEEFQSTLRQQHGAEFAAFITESLQNCPAESVQE